MHIVSKSTRKNAHFVARMVHDKLWLTFPQCVQLIMTNAVSHGHNIANRNIRKHNERMIEQNTRQGTDPALGTLGEYDQTSFTELFNKEVDFALSCKNKVW